MRLDRLFHVLVVMSAPPAAVACGSGDDGSDQQRGGSSDGDEVDAAVDPGGNATVDASNAGSGSGSDLMPCFCNVDSCCDRSGAEATVLDGFECCWSTTCP